MKDEPATWEKLKSGTEKLELYRAALSALHKSEPTVQTAGKIPEADIVLLDEIFKCNDGVLNSLLTALNERKYTNEGRTYPIPVISFLQPPMRSLISTIRRKRSWKRCMTAWN